MNELLTFMVLADDEVPAVVVNATNTEPPLIVILIVIWFIISIVSTMAVVGMTKLFANTTSKQDFCLIWALVCGGPITVLVLLAYAYVKRQDKLNRIAVSNIIKEIKSCGVE